MVFTQHPQISPSGGKNSSSDCWKSHYMNSLVIWWHHHPNGCLNRNQAQMVIINKLIAFEEMFIGLVLLQHPKQSWSLDPIIQNSFWRQKRMGHQRGQSVLYVHICQVRCNVWTISFSIWELHKGITSWTKKVKSLCTITLPITSDLWRLRVTRNSDKKSVTWRTLMIWITELDEGWNLKIINLKGLRLCVHDIRNMSILYGWMVITRGVYTRGSS